MKGTDMARTSAPTFTATRSTVVGPKHTTHTVTVRDASRTVTDTRNSRSMMYVEVLVTPAGKITTCSQKVGGTPNVTGTIRVPVASVMDTPPVEPVSEPVDAKAALVAAVKDIAKVPARKLTLSAADIAREQGIDPYAFRMYLRKHGVARTPAAMRKAAKAMGK